MPLPLVGFDLAALAVRRPLRVAVIALGVAFPAVSTFPAGAQTTPISTLEMTVIGSELNDPLASVEIFIDGSRAGITDTRGWVAIQVPPGAAIEVEVRRIGFKSRVMDIGVPPGESILLTVPLEIQPVLIAGVEATGTPRARSARLDGFYQRIRTGAGEYITRAEIERLRPRDLTDLFRTLPGIRVTSTPGGDRPSLEARRSIGYDLVNPEASPCAIQYYIDGSPIKPIHDGVLGAEIMVHEIEGIEIYRRGSTTAAQYQRMSGGCGVILIWKKDRE